MFLNKTSRSFKKLSEGKNFTNTSLIKCHFLKGVGLRKRKTPLRVRVSKNKAFLVSL